MTNVKNQQSISPLNTYLTLLFFLVSGACYAKAPIGKHAPTSNLIVVWSSFDSGGGVQQNGAFNLPLSIIGRPIAVTSSTEQVEDLGPWPPIFGVDETPTPTPTMVATATPTPPELPTPTPTSLPFAPGDCNGDDIIDAGDLTALVLEIFDGDGTDPANAPGGTFPGTSVGCDSNGDNTIDAGDITCITLLIFNGPGSCSGREQLEASGRAPVLSVPAAQTGSSGDSPVITVHFEPNGQAIAALAFSLRVEDRCLLQQHDSGIESSSKLPGNGSLSVQRGLAGASTRLDVALLPETGTDGLSPIPPGPVLEVPVALDCLPLHQAVRFAEWTSFGSAGGRSIPGHALVEGAEVSTGSPWGGSVVLLLLILLAMRTFLPRARQPAVITTS